MRPYISRVLCTDCGECLRVCPYDAFAKEQDMVRVATPEDCIECGACVEHCTVAAIYFDD